MEDLEKPPVVIQAGSGSFKVGFAGEDRPAYCFPAVVGVPKNEAPKDGDQATACAGEEALLKRETLDLRCPISHGIVTDWSDFEVLLDHAFKKLNINPAEHAVLLTEVALNPKTNREKLLEVLFDQFHVMGVYIQCDTVLSLHACDVTTGVVLHSGHGLTQVVPIYEGFAVRKAILCHEIGGEDIERALVTKIERTLTPEIIRGIKESVCYVAADVKSERAQDPSQYTLPDGSTVRVGEERYLAPEEMFKMTSEDGCKGVQEMLCRAISKCDAEYRDACKRSIILSGGNTMFPGFQERLTSELKLLGTEAKIVAPPDRTYLVWKGGSKLASLSSFQQMMVSVEDYDRQGAAIVHQKCF